MPNPQTIPQFLPGNSPLELKTAPGLTGQILRPVDDWILHEAERREDCWRFLMGVRGMPVACHDLFRAAESASIALHRLVEIAWGAATLQRSVVHDMHCAKGGEKIRLAKNVFRAYDKFNGYGEPANEMERVELDAIRRAGKREIEKRELPTWGGFSQEHRAEVLMVYGWLRWGVDGEPGLCFYSDEALADFATLTLGREQRDGLGTRVGYYRKIRQRLGLVPAYFRKPTITKVRRKEFTRQDNGERTTCIAVQTRDKLRPPLTAGFDFSR